MVPPPLKNGGRGERRPQESQRGTPSDSPEWPRPSEGGVGGRGEGAGRLASEEAEVEEEGRRRSRKEEPEGRGVISDFSLGGGGGQRLLGERS